MQDGTVKYLAGSSHAIPGLKVVGHSLVITDTGNHGVRVFDLWTRRLRTLVGHPSQNLLRMGPVGLYSPQLAPEACAALASPRALAMRADGTCLVSQGATLVGLDVVALAEGAPAH